MIIPIHILRTSQFNYPKIDEELLLIKEPIDDIGEIKISAYNKNKEKLGFLGIQSLLHQQVYSKLTNNYFYGIVFCITRNNILVEIDYPKNTSPSNYFQNNVIN